MKNLALWSDGVSCAQAGWATPFVEFVLAYLLMGTENIGIQIEEPFCIMPLAAFCAGNEESVVEIMDGLTGKPRHSGMTCAILVQIRGPH